MTESELLSVVEIPDDYFDSLGRGGATVDAIHFLQRSHVDKRRVLLQTAIALFNIGVHPSRNRGLHSLDARR